MNSRKKPQGKGGGARKPAPRHTPQGRGAASPARRASQPQLGSSKSIRWIAAAVVAIVAIALVVAIGGGTSTKKDSAYGRSPASAALVSKVTSVPTATIDKIGLGSATLPEKISDTRASGKPAILFIGAEFCPFCAAERWAIVNALGRFGTFSNLSVTHSSITDVHPNTQTFSFYKSSYTSKYLTFSTVEFATNQPDGSGYKHLEDATAAQAALWNKYTQGGVPFLYLDGTYFSGSTYDVALLQGKSHNTIADALSDPNSPIAKAAIGTANGITAAICTLTNDQPASACTVPTITDLASQL